MIRSSATSDKHAKTSRSWDIEALGGFLKALPACPPRSVMHTEEDLHFYVSQFSKHGFHGPLCWYRNMDENWVWDGEVADVVTQRVLLIDLEHDKYFPPSLSSGVVESLCPNLTRVLLRGVGHFALEESPEDLSNIIVQYIKKLPSLVVPKL
eukprot:TRINITY_DN5149_c0_g1_i1.p1 TRINITY_DN5149_c0_g1~~TRINITY_DN5149_c0_g1_i1.p1  ORF type:complete len:152 (+),score=37.15 TRINITY_DN5149_c0_g1_i1:556-1011(+)